GTSLTAFTGAGLGLPLPPAGGGFNFSDGSVNPATPAAGGTGVLAGTVYFDNHDNGTKDTCEVGATRGVILPGIEDPGTRVFRGTTTTAAGTYVFGGLRAGTYTISTPSLPATMVAGLDTPGTLGGFPLRNDQIADITLANGQKGVGYNFGEQHA